MNSDHARQQMVEQQVRTWDVFDERVLDVLLSVPHEHYVPAGCRGVAYADTEIPIGHGQVMLRPSLEGRLLQALAIDDGHSVLEIGTGSGYLTACIAALARAVTSVDIFADFASTAGKRLAAQDVANVTLETMDVMTELPDGGFDAVAVTGAIPRFDDRFLTLLNPGGRLFLIVGKPPVNEALLIERASDDAFARKVLFETDVPTLVNADTLPEFSF